jgi:hypothetical protein
MGEVGRSARASAVHRHAAAVAVVAGTILDGYPHSSAPQQQLAARLRASAATLAPGWAGAPLDAVAASTPIGGNGSPAFLRVGQAHPLDDARFPVVVPLLGVGHLAIDADARDPRVAGLLRSLVLRLVAAAPAGSLRIRAVDAIATFEQFEGPMPASVGDLDGLRAVLAEAESWVPAPDGPVLLIVIGALPELTEPDDLARIAALAAAGPALGVHLVVAGWPPPPLTPESTQAPLPLCTQISVRNPYAWVGDPPGTAFAAEGVRQLGGRLNAPVYLDPDPPADLVRRVRDQLAAAPTSAGRPSAVQAARLDYAVQAAWLDDVDAAQRLDAVRHNAVDGSVNAAREELAALRAAVGPTGPDPADLASARRALGDASVPALRAGIAAARAALQAPPAAERNPLLALVALLAVYPVIVVVVLVAALAVLAVLLVLVVS